MALSIELLFAGLRDCVTRKETHKQISSNMTMIAAVSFDLFFALFMSFIICTYRR